MSSSVYNETIKMFGSQPERPFESSEQQAYVWGQQWGCDNDVGQIRVCLMHRPGPELGLIDTSKRIEVIGSYGDIDAGWYWQSETVPDMIELRAQQDDEWVVNFLAVRPGRVIMPHGLSDKTRSVLGNLGVEVIEIAYDKVQLNGGGIHCSTCPLIRDSVN